MVEFFDPACEVCPSRADAERPEIAATLRLDTEDVATALEQTPTFFVNEMPLSFGLDQLLASVQAEQQELPGMEAPTAAG